MSLYKQLQIQLTNNVKFHLTPSDIENFFLFEETFAEVYTTVLWQLEEWYSNA